MVIVILILGSAFATVSTVLFIYTYWDLPGLHEYINTFADIQRYMFAGFLTLFCLGWGWGFKIYLAEKKEHEISHYAGIISVLLFCIGCVGVLLFQHIIFVYVFCLSGFLSLYCYSVNALKWFKSKTTSFELDAFILFTLAGGGSLYLLNGYASILINEVFSINASYFPFTKVVAILLVSVPFLLLLCFLAMVFVFWKKKGETDGKEDFYYYNLLASSYVVLVMIFALDNNRSETLEMVATKFDFDSRSPCIFEDSDINKSISGYIVLDPGHSQVFTYSKDRTPKYKVMPCITTLK